MQKYIKAFVYGTKTVPSDLRSKVVMFNLVLTGAIFGAGIYLDRMFDSNIFGILTNGLLIMPIYFQYIKPFLKMKMSQQ